MFCKIDSLYICVNDMERAIKFYEEFFEQEVSEKGDVQKPDRKFGIVFLHCSFGVFRI